MQHKLFCSIAALLFLLHAGGQTRLTSQLRIVDTLSAQEKLSRQPILLRSEVDSIIRQWDASKNPMKPVETSPEVIEVSPGYLLPVLLLIVVSIGLLCYLFYKQQRKWKLVQGSLVSVDTVQESLLKKPKGKMSTGNPETKISDLKAELTKLAKENEGLNRVVKEYNGIQHEYDSLRHGLLKSYKVRNYPGYDKSKQEAHAFQGVLDTENTVANFAFESFLKPILSITDANKNIPANITEEDQAKLIDLLVSLSLFYIEYLYLRVNELSIGGKMVQRIKQLNKNKEVDTALLKHLDTEFGSRALVLRMALDKINLQALTYPVFDETHLNHKLR